MSITKDMLREMFDYEDGQLINRFTRSPRAVAGSLAGSKNPSTGYWRIGINKTVYQLSRVIWLWHYGWIDDAKVIDHIDGDIDNNRIENLRLCTHAENEWNKESLGVHFQGGKWRARAKHNGENYSFGTHDTKEQATAAYMRGVQSLRADFIGRKRA